MVRVLFLCTGNSCRSQMAEGFARALSHGGIEVYSAGPAPVGVHSLAVEVMKERGIDISAQTSKSLEAAGVEADIVITMCGEADETCPSYPGKAQILHWPLRDPARARGSREEILQVFRGVRDEIEKRVTELLLISRESGGIPIGLEK